MSSRRIFQVIRALALAGIAAFLLSASEFHGDVKFGGLPVPGATVTATQGDRKFSAVTDDQGVYSFPDLPDGAWTLQVEMLGFTTIREEMTIPQDPRAWELKMLPLSEMNTQVQAPPPPAPPTPAPTATARNRNARTAPTPTNNQTPFQRSDVNATAPGGDAAAPSADPEVAQRATDGFLINGTSNNGASSPFAQSGAFGNNRRGARSLYTGNFGLTFDNSSLDARSYSLTGQDTSKPAYNRFTGLVSLGGPIRIPSLIRNGPNFVLNYQWTRNSTATTTPGLMPTLAERSGSFSGIQVLDPTTGLPFANNLIPATRISPQAQALLNFYPLPNFDGNARYNYQIPVIGITHQDSLQSRINKGFRKDQFFGLFSFQSTRADSSNLFGFLDTTDTLGFNTNVNWRHAFTPRFASIFGYQFSRLSTRVIPNFENRQNVSGQVGIAGNNQDPLNWGPPALNFSGGISGLSDQNASFNRTLTSALTYSSLWNRSSHNITFGGDYRKQQFNDLSQQNPRGTFTFNGTASGNDLADFLLGVPDTSALAFGNADKYFRSSNYDAYITDDWRVNSGLTINPGVRWEYWAPMTELYGRLVNLDIAPGYSAVAPVVANNPAGSLTGQHYPDSLVRPDKHAFQPRVGLSWRPLPASSLVVRAGYGVYYNTSVYQTIANQMAQQPPLSKTLSVQDSASNPLTLANGFKIPNGTVPNTFAIDPNFQVGYAQNWQLSVQRDLPGSLVMTATYLGSKGTRGVQQFLPNTYPAGAASPCLSCPSGFTYMTSNGNSTRESGQLQLRRRLHSGFTSTLQYTYAKAIDDAALGGRGQGTAVIAQNWLDLSAERGLSTFDQRHQLTAQVEYTSGMGLAGGTLLSGWRGALLKEWTATSQITAGTGMPLTPIYLAAVPGTGVTGPIRPEYTGAPIYAAPPGLSLNPEAYAAPPLGQWGNAGRNTITGPVQFTMNASLGRTFRMNDRLNLELRVDSTNPINHVTYPNWNTTMTSAQFGLPNTANAMRNLATTLRLRF